MLELELLGPMRVTLDGTTGVVPPKYPKQRALLAYLAVEADRAHGRDMLAGLLWPNQSRDLARQSLRQTLSILKRQFGEAGERYWLADAATIRFNAGSDHRLDCVQLLQAVPPGRPAAPCRSSGEAALAAYRGPFLDDLSLPACPDFEEWKNARRDDFAAAARTISERLVACCISSGELEAALDHARRCVTLDPWSDPAWRRVLHLTALTRGRAAALAAHDEYCRVLARELGAEPEEEVARLAQALRDGNLPPLSGVCACRVDPSAAAMAPDERPVRRLVTVLYCDVAWPPAAEPEMLQDASDQLLALAAPILRRYGGHRFDLGIGGVLASFGYPLSDEHGALSAIHAARALCAAAPADLDIRVGLHAGPVVAQPGEAGARLIGHAPKAAMAVFAHAPARGIALSEAVRRLVQSAIRCDRLGEYPIREIGPAAAVYAASGRLDQDVADLAPLTGRDAEMALLRSAWEAARAGGGRVVVICGDAGMGKSRLTRELRRHVRTQATWWVCRCVRQFQESPEAAFVELVEDLAGIVSADDEAGRLAKLEALLDGCGAGRGHAMALAGLVGAGQPGERDAAGWKAWWHGLLALLAAQTRCAPLVLEVADLHWADNSTLEALQALLGAIADLPVLVVIATRPSFEPAWLRAVAQPTIHLAPLDDEAVRRLVRAAGPALSVGMAEAIADRAAGIPFFAEEMVRCFLHDMASGTPALRVPDSLENLLVGELESLGAARRIVVVASVIGATIDGNLLRALAESGCGISLATLRQDLDRLVARGVLVRHASDWFSFRHALIQEAAYGTLPTDQRRDLHRAVAAALVHFPHLARPEVLARHHHLAGNHASALECWEQAAHRALARHADAEAASLFRQAIAALGHQPEGPPRDARELALQLSLAESLIAPTFYGTDDLGHAYARALELSERLGDDRALFPALRGMWSYYMRCHIPTACDLAAKLLRLAEADGGAPALFHAHYAHGNALYWSGRHQEALRYLDRALALDGEIDWSGMEPVSRFDRAATRIFHALALLYLGREDEAEMEVIDFIAWGKRQDHPHTLVFILGVSVGFALTRRDFATARTRAEELAGEAERNGFQFWSATAKLLGGAALRSAEGYHLMLQALEERAGMGQSDAISYGFLADCAHAAGLWREGLEAAATAFDLAHRRGDAHYLPEILRIKAELLFDSRSGRDDEAIRLLQAARDLARDQGAALFERRAALQLAARLSGPHQP